MLIKGDIDFENKDMVQLMKDSLDYVGVGEEVLKLKLSDGSESQVKKPIIKKEVSSELCGAILNVPRNK